MICRFAFLALLGFLLLASPAIAQPVQDTAKLESQLQAAELKIHDLEKAIQKETSNNSYALGLVVFLFGGVCAIWAQNTDRNPWKWFFLGVFFNVFALGVVLFQNGQDNFWRRNLEKRKETIQRQLREGKTQQ